MNKNRSDFNEMRDRIFFFSALQSENVEAFPVWVKASDGVMGG